MESLCQILLIYFIVCWQVCCELPNNNNDNNNNFADYIQLYAVFWYFSI